MAPSPKAQVAQLLKSIETGDAHPVGYIHPGRYVQHNLAVADGLAGFDELLAQLPKDSARVNTVRVFQDGDFVFTHTDYDFFGPKVGFDIFRFEDGKIVEHWDNLQDKPTTPNPSGHSMIDGALLIADLEQTEENKALVHTFIDDILIHGRMERLSGYFDGDRYIQHNPHIASGLTALGSALRAMAQEDGAMKYERVHRILGEGNFVLSVSEGHLGRQHVAFYDLWRIESGKIAEHWDTIEAIAPQAQWKNGNGKF